MVPESCISQGGANTQTLHVNMCNCPLVCKNPGNQSVGKMFKNRIPLEVVRSFCSQRPLLPYLAKVWAGCAGVLVAPRVSALGLLSGVSERAKRPVVRPCTRATLHLQEVGAMHPVRGLRKAASWSGSLRVPRQTPRDTPYWN